MGTETTARRYAIKMVEVAYHETIPNKETVTNVFEVLINEYTECQINKQTKNLTEQLAEKEKELKESNSYYEITREQNKRLLDDLKEVEQFKSILDRISVQIFSTRVDSEKIINIKSILKNPITNK